MTHRVVSARSRLAEHLRNRLLLSEKLTSNVDNYNVIYFILKLILIIKSSACYLHYIIAK